MMTTGRKLRSAWLLAGGTAGRDTFSERGRGGNPARLHSQQAVKSTAGASRGSSDAVGRGRRRWRRPAAVTDRRYRQAHPLVHHPGGFSPSAAPRPFSASNGRKACARRSGRITRMKAFFLYPRASAGSAGSSEFGCGGPLRAFSCLLRGWQSAQVANDESFAKIRKNRRFSLDD